MAAISKGTVHALPIEMARALRARPSILAIWESLTPLARNEWICWVTFVKQEKTKREHIERMIEQLKEGKRRPCCWIGCIHRTDKKISPSIQAVLKKRSGKK